MPANNDINLIPSEVIKERSLKKNYRKGLIFSSTLLFLSLVAAGVVFYLSTNSQNRITELERTITSKNAEIADLEDVERQGSILTARLSYIDKILNSQLFYSRLMKEIDLKLIPGITVTNVTVSGDYNVNISGISSSTTVLQSYIDGLVEGPDNLFSNARILEVSIKEGGGNASFKVAVTADSEKLIGEK